MILGDLSDTKRVEALHPLLGKLFSYIKEHDFLSDSIGRIELDGDRVFINNDYPILRSQSEQVVEVHRRYLDVHVPLDAPEIVGGKPLCDLKEVQQTYSEEKDCAFYSDRPSTYFTVYPGQFLIVFPEDGHAPIIGEGRLRKICAKIKL